MTAYELAINLYNNGDDPTLNPEYRMTASEAEGILHDFRLADEGNALEGITAEDLAAEFNTLYTAHLELNAGDDA